LRGTPLANSSSPIHYVLKFKAAILRQFTQSPKLASRSVSSRTRWAAGILVMLLSFLLSLRSPDVNAAAPSASATTRSVAPAPAAGASAEIAALLLKLENEDAAARKETLEQLAHTGDARLEAVFADLSEGSLYIWKGRAVTCKTMDTEGDKKIAPLIDPLTRDPILIDGKPARVPEEDIKVIAVSRRDRVVIRDVTSLLRLSNPDRTARLAAIIKAGEGAVESNLPALQALETTEKDAAVKSAIKESIALILLAKTGDDAETKKMHIDSARTLGGMRSARALSRIEELRKAETDAAALQTYDQAINSIKSWQSVVQWIGVAFSGLSASSILILMALGLSITFGLMGVINMAHGELMMIGAYATYETQQIFEKVAPAHIDGYFIAAIPISFVAAAIVGLLIEAIVIRFMYGRPLDTLLATLGVSFILIWFVRINYGDSIGVKAPIWLQGSVEIMQDVRLPYNRLFVLAFCAACVGLMYFIINRTKMGLLLRATTQNRTMASSLGVSTRKIDMLTFALGSGLAGMAGCAMTQIGGVTPDMGQNYIIESFLVVVVGGVGKLAGVIWSGMGLGLANKFLEPVTGAVWAKVLQLLLIIAFIQWRPSGLFPAKGRLADA
jgi:urea transport system permease protein